MDRTPTTRVQTRQANITTGLRVVLEWIREQRRQYVLNMRKTIYYMYRRYSMRTLDRSGYPVHITRPELLPSFGQGLIAAANEARLRQLVRQFPGLIGLDFYKYPGL